MTPVSKTVSEPISKPVFPAQLINEPAQTNPPEPTTALGPLEHLVGTWTNKDNPNTGKGGQDSPYSYNLMPLPQVDPSSPYGYILKNFSYYEEITFSAIHGTAPNRGGLGTQVSNTLFYEQRVYFAEGPGKDQLVHAENGSWLYITDAQQKVGPYGPGLEPRSHPPQQSFNLAKQVSVPHGNSILAGGHYVAAGPTSGAPVIGQAPLTFPTGVDTTPYTTQTSTFADFSNPNPQYTANPNLPLTEAVLADPPSSFIQLDVDTETSGHPISNIAFEAKFANVVRYFATYWLEAFNGSSTYDQLQYSQTILMAFPVAGAGTVVFPHVTTNTLRKL